MCRATCGFNNFNRKMIPLRPIAPHPGGSDGDRLVTHEGATPEFRLRHQVLPRHLAVNVRTNVYPTLAVNIALTLTLTLTLILTLNLTLT